MTSSLFSRLIYPLVDLTASFFDSSDKDHDGSIPLLEESGLSTAAPSSGSLTPTMKDSGGTININVDAANTPPKVFRSNVQIFEKGVHTVWEHQPPWTDSIPGLQIWQNPTEFYESWSFFGRFVRDVYDQGAFLCITTITAHLLQHVQPTLALVQSSFMLNVVEKAVSTKQLDRTALALAIASIFFGVIFKWVIDQILATVLPVMKKRMQYLFNQRFLALKLRLDLPTSELPEVKAKFAAVQHNDYWDCFDHVLSLIGLGVEIILQASFMYGTLCKQPGGTQTALLSLIYPVVTFIEGRAFGQPFYCVVTNPAYKRITSLWRFSYDTAVKKEVLGNVMGKHIGEEYRDARNELGDKDVVAPEDRGEYWSPYQLGRKMINETAVIAVAMKAIADPESTPLTSIALLQQTSLALSWTVWRLSSVTGSIYESFTKLKLFYEMEEIENVVKDGMVSYPRTVDSSEKISGVRGMKIEFKDVSFKYPNTEATVIDKLCFKIAAGSTVVIVGENGCGKSSSMMLLSRLYDVTGGEILIDDLPITEYKINDLRAATAIMHQDYHHFDLSLQENIGLGNVSKCSDLDAVKEAAKLGGAHEFIEKRSSGYATVMDWKGERGVTWGNVPEGSALEAKIKADKVTKTGFSGGETQRLALSRVFMRSTTCDTRLLAYDEPSAALDPKAEFALFERLRNLRGGRTMIFITHRFGYLTKYADLIIYMEKGRAVEQGSHEELLALNGQYASLYNVQAQAFA